MRELHCFEPSNALQSWCQAFVNFLLNRSDLIAGVAAEGAVFHEQRRKALPTIGARLYYGCTGFVPINAPERKELDSKDHPGASPSPSFSESRRHPRYPLQVDIGVYSRRAGLLKGYTVDISESGISAILRLEVDLGELVQLEFTLPSGPISIRGLVRYRTAFRYGFQFVEPDPQGAIKSMCARLAMEQSSRPAPGGI